MKRLSKWVKFDVGLTPQSLNGNATGRYYSMSLFRSLLVVLNAAAIAATKSAKVELLQATDSAGTGAKGIPSTAGQLATASIAANTKVTAATLTCAAVQVGDKVTVNGVVFTGAAAADLPNNVYLSNPADNTATAASLAAAINHAAGVPGVTATPAVAVVTLTATAAGDNTITIADAAATITPATTQAQAFVELDVSQLDLANGFEYVAAKVTTDAAIVVGTVMIRGDGRFEPDQYVAASATV
jgi:hypothetical protein